MGLDQAKEEVRAVRRACSPAASVPQRWQRVREYAAVLMTAALFSVVGCSSDVDVFVGAQDFDEEVPFHSGTVEDATASSTEPQPYDTQQPSEHPSQTDCETETVDFAAALRDSESPMDFVVSSYALDYSVSLDEAKRRLDRNQPLQEILASIRELEGNRLAGWGIDHGPNFGGWVWLTGDTAPGGEAACIAAAHADVVIRTGADYSLAELLAAQQRLFRNDTTGYPEPSVAPMVTFTSIDMAANAVGIGIDPALAAVPPGDLVGSQPVSVSDEEFQAKAAEVTELLRDLISVNFVVEDGRGFSNG